MNTNIEKPTTIDDYIACYSPEVQKLLQDIRRTISDAAPEAKEKISYGMPTFTLSGNLVHFAACKNHIGFYPASSGIHAFEKELSEYKIGRGSVQFPFDKEMPHQLIRQITQFRVNENIEREKEKKLRRRKKTSS